MHGRDAEHGDQGVADHLLDRAAVALHRLADGGVEARHHAAQDLGVEPLAQLSGSDHVAEQHGDGLSHLAGGLILGDQGRAAGVAEARLFRVFNAASRARDHARESTPWRLRGALRVVWGGWFSPTLLSTGREWCSVSPMRGIVSLEQRLDGHVPSPATRRVTRGSFNGAARGGLRARIQASIDRAVRIFELDRLLYEIEVEAQGRWLRTLMAFDAYCARRDAGGSPDAPVR